MNTLASTRGLRHVPLRALLWMHALVGLASAAGCDGPALPESSYYDERIGTVFNNQRSTCVNQTTGCHVAGPRGTAAGNVDLTSYDSLLRREDILQAYGPYSDALILLKASASDPVNPPPAVSVHTYGESVLVSTDVRHVAGNGIQRGSADYATLKSWITSGYARTGLPTLRAKPSSGGCSDRLVEHKFAAVGYTRGVDVAPLEAFDFARVEEVLMRRCASSSCHGSPIADFYLACGDNGGERTKWNRAISLDFLQAPAATSELLNRPLAIPYGGTFHEGGDVFESTDDPDYQTLLAWAEAVEDLGPGVYTRTAPDAGFEFFANRVQPVLVQKGCMFLNCHSPSMFHDLRLAGGSRGFFSKTSTHRNYEMSRLQLAIESPAVNDSRIVAKNLFVANTRTPDGAVQGLNHRGGSLLEDFREDPNTGLLVPVDASVSSGGFSSSVPASPELCDRFATENPTLVPGGDWRALLSSATGETLRALLRGMPAYCVFLRWHEVERELAIARGEIADLAGTVHSVVWVARPVTGPGAGSVLDFDTYRPGSDLRVSAATYAAGSITLATPAGTSAVAGCGALASAQAGGQLDVRAPAVSWDGQRIAFAARTSAGEPYRLYWMNRDLSACEPIPGISPASPSQDGVLTHDIDPAFAPDGRIVFASSRSGTRTAAALAPNANLYVFDPATSTTRQLTFLLNQEVTPDFMADGRVILTTQKREPEFHQLAGRRINLDGGDYHPLFAQRGSIGFAAATEIIELPNRNLAMIAAPIDATDGGGALAIVNRSIGPDQTGRDPEDRYYLSSRRYLDRQSVDDVASLESGAGVFRSPARLPSGLVLVSCARGAALDAGPPYDYDLCLADPSNRLADVTMRVAGLGGSPGMADVDAVAVYARPDRGVFTSRIDEANGHTRVEPGADDAIVHVQDFPLLATLLFTNTREGRAIDDRIGGFEILEALAPPSSATDFGAIPGSAGTVVTDAFGSVFVGRRSRGSVGLAADGSARFRVRGGVPIVLRVNDRDGRPLSFAAGAPFTGVIEQREQMQFYPGERSNQSIQRRFFNGLCGGCHGSITNRELDAAVDVDILTGASRTLSVDAAPSDHY